MIVKTLTNTYGVYKTVELVGSNLVCDGVIALPISVIGSYEILADNTLMEYPQAVEPVPTFVYPRQIRLALTRVGLRSAVETHVAASGQDLKDWWEFSNEFYRENPHVIETANALGVSSSQLDDLWRLARSL